ncbi:hypothetical protein CF70_002140 [Cupriavidus sp. SK-3]|uniref:hypothetical protein n=1 Tax=Cupriavidus sp. SK-3 TaxID=1470558 RepID=UPI00044A9706|nr:hypothetical protein CF70_002140 [Cupriavidus sp. SK-3]
MASSWTSLLQMCGDKAAAKRFSMRLLARSTNGPHKIVTDQLRSYPAPKAEIAKLEGMLSFNANNEAGLGLD